MKRLFSTAVTFLFLLAFLPAPAQKDVTWEKNTKKYEHVKERTISKTYPASGNTLNIDNSFGDVNLTVGGSEIKVDIHIEVSATDADLAQRIFDNIDVTDSREGNQVKFRTNTNKNDKGNNYNCKNCSSNMRIDYTVQVPAGTPLNIDNSFGSIKLPDYTGEADLTSKFGSLTTGTLAKTKNIHVEFGKADIKSTGDADYTFKFSTINIGNLEGNVKMNAEFCNMSRVNLGSGLTSFTLKESYSTLALKPAVNLSVSYEITTSFGSFKNKTGTEIKRTDEPDRYADFDKTYSGKSGSGNIKVNIKSSFGNIILGDATDEELKEKKKGKSDGKEI
ncbi:MAG: hypothetical protein U0U70_12895 [Chitinophagaceae bacterium]